MSSSPTTHSPSSTRNFQLCQAQVIRLPSSEPCVIPYPSCGQAWSRAKTPSEVLTRQSRWSSARTIFIDPIGRSSSRATTVASGRQGCGEAFIRRNGRTSTMVEVKRFSVGELAARAGVATSALRFYEANGLIGRSATGRVTVVIDPMRCAALRSSRSPSGSGCRSARWRGAGSLPSSRTPTSDDWNELRVDGCHGSTSRSPPWNCCAIDSTGASAADACRSIRASCTTPVIGRTTRRGCPIPAG